jgi:hypothetical protein
VVTPGHLFVAHGDLKRLACDALLLPCDSAGNINSAWRTLLPADLPQSRLHRGWLTLPEPPVGRNIKPLDRVDDRYLAAYATVDVEMPATPEDVVDRTWAALKSLSTGLEARDGRVVPLIGLPLAGTGDGGLSGQRATVIELLLRRHRSQPLGIDVALVLNDRRDFAAVQERRADKDFPELSDDLRMRADRLGRLAAEDRLSLFLGAGVSRPAGLPDWWTLLRKLAHKAGLEPPHEDQDPYDAATPIVKALGDSLHPKMQELLGKRQHAIGHALLASLRVTQMVTTNYDRCMEFALKVPQQRNFRVLIRQQVDGGEPWLLKLNGDIRQPESIILSRRDLDRESEERPVLEGVVQTLLLTSHLLFVGYSLTDKKFLKLAAAVEKIRQRAEDWNQGRSGTAIALTPDELERAEYKDLDMFSMEEPSLGVAARQLEIFLDRLVWTAVKQGNLSSEYLLDDRYEYGMSAEDLALRKALLDLVDSASAEAKQSSAWARVRSILADLGLEHPNA